MAAIAEDGVLEGQCPLSVTVRVQGTTTVIELRGEWDLAGEPAVEQALRSVFDGDPECVVLDLSRLGFIDSSGLQATVDLAHRAAARGVRLVIIPGSRAVQSPFEMCGLVATLPFIDPRVVSGDAR